MVAPAFGEADLSNCEREQIHLAGSTQPHGALLVVGEPDLVVLQASANAPAFLDVSGDLLGRPLRAVSPDLDAGVRALLRHPLDAIPVALRGRVGSNGESFVGLLHRPPEGGVVLELERAGEGLDVGAHIEPALHTIVNAPSIRSLCDETARIFRSLTGYDRVMVYRFDDEGHGEVFSEEKRQALEAFLGNRYPASDIPQIARRLYERNRVRVLVDVHAEPVPIVPRLSPQTGQDLDMSLCFTRTMSPIHIQYLKNMGVCATLVVSLMVGGRLWGLVSCHHYEPRTMQFEMRGVCELLAEAVGTRIAALESFAQSQAELSVRRLEQRMIEAIARHGDWRSALFDGSQSILKPVGATGAALLLDDNVLTTGEVPSTQHLRDIGSWLDRKGLDASGPTSLFATASLGGDAPEFVGITSIASGLLAAPISSMPGDYIVWFRSEQVRTVTWGGNPFKPVVVGNNPSDLSPRRSFAQWHQVVEGTSAPWTPAELTTARLIGATLRDVVIQFRSVRLLIAQDQLDMVGRQVQRSDQAVIVASRDGSVFMTSQAFEDLLPRDHAPLGRLDDLPQLFANPTALARRIRRLVERNDTWRGDAELLAGGGKKRPVLVRADPVFSAPGKVLGFVVVVADMLEQKAADAARRRFQEQIVSDIRLAPERLESDADLRYQNLLAAVVENAQLAALEIADGVDARNMPALLESVKGSVDRSAELLRHLIRRAPKG